MPKFFFQDLRDLENMAIQAGKNMILDFRHKVSNRMGGLTSRHITVVLKARMMGGGHFVDEAREQADADRTMGVIESS